MIRFPSIKKVVVVVETEGDSRAFPTMKCNSIKQFCEMGVVQVGSRFIVDGWWITCIDIDGDKYYFSYDEVPVCAAHKDIEKILKDIYTTGKVGNIKVMPKELRDEVEYLFVPSEYQVFGENKYGVKETGVKQFEYFKRGDISRVKGYRGKEIDSWRQGETLPWWLSTVYSGHSTSYCDVASYGLATSHGESNTTIGVPVFFEIKVTKK